MERENAGPGPEEIEFLWLDEDGKHARPVRAPAAKVAGPSNIGNYLARLGIPATAGFGVDYQGLHGTDERIRLDSIPVVQAAYHQALLTLLHAA
jgi:acetylornithine deacetylase/succinyl-diaminopimelate desuccinylase-like protein